jgi:tetratricopeptide (TPR) repeat protein
MQIPPTAITRLEIPDLRKKDYKSALQSFEQALDIKQNLHGKIHSDVSRVCSKIGLTKYFLKEYDTAVHWHQQFVDISMALYGKELPASATSCYWIAEYQYEMQDYDSALDSCQHALEIRLKLPRRRERIYKPQLSPNGNDICKVY